MSEEETFFFRQNIMFTVKLMKKIISLILTLLLLSTALLIPANAYLGSTQKQLINSAPLTPYNTGYTPLDNLVQNLFNSWFTPGMTPYEKLIKCYDFLVYNSRYGNSLKLSSVYNGVDRECNYYGEYDRECVVDAYCFMSQSKPKVGSCNDFARSFMVLARALGFECYVMDGSITWSGRTNRHFWCLIKLNGSYYSFDTQAEFRNYESNGSVSYSNFCVAEYLQTSRTYNRSQNIAKFNGFKCRNKTNNPGQTVFTDPVEEKTYEKGRYITNSTMYFRADHSTSGNAIALIDAGTYVDVEEIFAKTGTNPYTWGKISYKGQTGWMSLDYSSFVDVSVLRGDADGDGEVSPGDARLILRHSLSLEKISAKLLNNADIDGDGEISSSDARRALRISTSLE